MYKALVASGVATASLLGYCVYFDHARRSAPDYKDKIRAKRTAARNASRDNEGQIFVPPALDQGSMQKFFMEQVQEGEERLATGEYELAVKHFVSAVLHCGQGYQLLQVLQSTMPPQVYKMMIEYIPKAQARLQRAKMGAAASAVPPPSRKQPKLVEEESVD